MTAQLLLELQPPAHTSFLPQTRTHSHIRTLLQTSCAYTLTFKHSMHVRAHTCARTHSPHTRTRTHTHRDTDTHIHQQSHSPHAPTNYFPCHLLLYIFLDLARPARALPHTRLSFAFSGELREALRCHLARGGGKVLAFTLRTTFPAREYDADAATLRDAGLVPNALLLMTLVT